ncbi:MULTISPECIES: glutathione S-transferase family protein [Sphingopyxis]|uniref:glutathione S-transferase family protein n=1 Tax=Sphingopyxis TaxID=165697 RepID=UPI00086BB768|nr:MULTISPECIES: glutathione S-transferase family protein [Sphingopyxis]APW71740.1 glutathione S-transferase [Sphingopyxis granuli]AVA12456.1 glutathione S-transferase family protein [Sphingopyxis sp. MG]ODU28069.1 MAG: glutathione S-transferase [Sphingopyxis sp. SCN 67-31]
MPVNPAAIIEITAFDWVPDFARGFVRDLRPRWACEEVGLDYAERLISAVDRPSEHFRDQPWGQVPVLRDGDVHLFESGAILLHLAEKDERLLPRDPQGRATVTSWLFAAYNSVEPAMFELSTVDLFAAGEPWAKLRRPGLIDFIHTRFGKLAEALGDRPYLAGVFSVADIAMATVLREGIESGAVAEHPQLEAYLARCLERPAFDRALKAQLAAFREEAGPAER